MQRESPIGSRNYKPCINLHKRESQRSPIPKTPPVSPSGAARLPVDMPPPAHPALRPEQMPGLRSGPGTGPRRAWSCPYSPRVRFPRLGRFFVVSGKSEPSVDVLIAATSARSCSRPAACLFVTKSSAEITGTITLPPGSAGISTRRGQASSKSTPLISGKNFDHHRRRAHTKERPGLGEIRGL